MSEQGENSHHSNADIVTRIPQQKTCKPGLKHTVTLHASVPAPALCPQLVSRAAFTREGHLLQPCLSRRGESLLSGERSAQHCRFSTPGGSPPERSPTHTKASLFRRSAAAQPTKGCRTLPTATGTETRPRAQRGAPSLDRSPSPPRVLTAVRGGRGRAPFRLLRLVLLVLLAHSSAYPTNRRFLSARKHSRRKGSPPPLSAKEDPGQGEGGGAPLVCPPFWKEAVAVAWRVGFSSSLSTLLCCSLCGRNAALTAACSRRG